MGQMMINVEEVVESLKTDGIWVSPDTYPYIDDFIEYIKPKNFYSGHVISQGSRRPMSFDEALADKRGMYNGFMCNHYADTLRAPHFFDFCIDFKPVAEQYFGTPARFYSVNSFWKKSHGAPGWHYDKDDVNQLVIFIYGDDILTPEDGPHCYIRGSNKWLMWRKDRLNDKGPDIQPGDEYKDKVLQIYGKKGTFFIEDTFGIHNGMAPKPGHKPRLVLWSRWSTNIPKTYYDDEFRPIPASSIPMEKDDYSDIKSATDLLVNWSL
jgi:hypothetical protein